MIYQIHRVRTAAKATEQGLALVLTLLVVALLASIVVGFTTVARLEQMAARNFTYHITSQDMAQLATGQALEQLTSAVEAGQAAGLYATQSGALYPIGDTPIELHSTGPDDIDINAAITGGFVSRDIGQPLRVGLNDATVAGRLVGRTAFYITDESSKLPINNAAAQRTSFNPSSPRPFALSGLSANLPGNATTVFSSILTDVSDNNNKSIRNWSYFFTSEQLASAVPGIGPTLSPRATVSTETNPTAASKTPWQTNKIRINDLPVSPASVQTISDALADPALAQVFGGHFGDKYGSVALQQIAANMLQLRTNHWPSSGDLNFNSTDSVLGAPNSGTPVSVPPTAGLLKKTNGIPQDFLGYTPFPMIEHLALGAVYGWTSTDTMTVKIFLECELFNPYSVDYPGGGQIVVQIDKARFAVDFQDGSPFGWRGPDGSATSLTPHNDQPDWNPSFSGIWDPWGGGNPNGLDPDVNRIVNPLNGIRIVSLPRINSKSSATIYFDFAVTFDEGNINSRLPGPIYCIIDSIKLLARPNDSSSIRDWCSGNDFFNALATNSSGPAQFEISKFAILGPIGTPTNPEALPPSSAVIPTQKLVREDPRMRPALNVSAGFPREAPGKVWKLISYAMDPPGPQDVVFQKARVPADPIGSEGGGQENWLSLASRAIYNGRLPTVLQSPNQQYVIGADLGKVYTGLPWRTLRMQPQSKPEVDARVIPDWVLLDLFEFSPANASPITPVNPNFRYISLGASQAGFGSGLRGQLAAWSGNAVSQTGASLTLSDPNTNESFVINSSATTFSGITQTPAQVTSFLTSTMANLETSTAWATPDNGWRAHRVQNLNFPAQALMLPSEIVEVARVADYISSPDRFKVNEYRSAALFPGLSTKGRFFTIYALGQALEGGTQPSVAATALLQTLVEVDDTTTPPTYRIIHQYPPAN